MMTAYKFDVEKMMVLFQQDGLAEETLTQIRECFQTLIAAKTVEELISADKYARKLLWNSNYLWYSMSAESARRRFEGDITWIWQKKESEGFVYMPCYSVTAEPEISLGKPYAFKAYGKSFKVTIFKEDTPEVTFQKIGYKGGYSEVDGRGERDALPKHYLLGMFGLPLNHLADESNHNVLYILYQKDSPFYVGRVYKTLKVPAPHGTWNLPESRFLEVQEGWVPVAIVSRFLYSAMNNISDEYITVQKEEVRSYDVVPNEWYVGKSVDLGRVWQVIEGEIWIADK